MNLMIFSNVFYPNVSFMNLEAKALHRSMIDALSPELSDRPLLPSELSNDAEGIHAAFAEIIHQLAHQCYCHSRVP